VLYALTQIFIFTSIHRYLRLRTNVLFWILVAFSSLGVIVGAAWYDKGFKVITGWTPLICYLFIIFISIVAQKNRVKEARILTIGFSIASISFLIFLAYGITHPIDHILARMFNAPSFIFMFYILSPPTAVSIFLAYDFARTGRRLQDKLNEVEILSEKNVAVEREKQELLASQNIQLEAKVNERTAALNHSINELKSAQSQLIQSEKMASLGELTAGIAHEIQNPLNFVNNFSELNEELIAEMKDELREGKIDGALSLADSVLENQKKINQHGKRADGIVKGMLQHSRSSSGVKEPTNINVLADEYLRLAYHGFRAKDKSFNAKFTTDFDPTIQAINVVPQEIGRVILNLINNAFYAVNEKSTFAEATADKGYEPSVTVSTKNSGTSILISVKDNGNGIPDSIKERIFQPFFTTKPTGQGTGLGLSLAYDIVTKGNGGELNVTTQEGRGSEFIITLPS
jgi:two-component system NtrC family sensor kinase